MPDKCKDVICRDTLAAHVDTFVHETTFLPLRVRWEGLKAIVPGREPSDLRAKGVDQVLRAYTEKELKNLVKVPTFNQFRKSVVVTVRDKKVKGAEVLAESAKKALEAESEKAYQELVRSAQQEAISKLKDDGKSVLTAPNKAEAMRRITEKFRQEHKVFASTYMEKGVRQRKSEKLMELDNLGLLFLERLRIRPIGHTVERAPFYELSLEPGEEATLALKSFSKRTTTLQKETEQTEERKLEYSSTFTTELQEEYERAIKESSEWGVNAKVSGEYGEAKEGKVSGGWEGNYGAKSSDDQTTKESSKKAETLTRKVETSQKVSHKTVVTLVTEETLEKESKQVFKNADKRTRKILMRRLMQVLHLSYERYGVRMCWAPCIKDPGRDVRILIPDPEAFPDETKVIRDRWENATPPPELGSPPQEQNIPSEWNHRDGGWGGVKEDFPLPFYIPEGYEFSEAYPETRNAVNNPTVKVTGKPPVGSTGSVEIGVHLGLDHRVIGEGKVDYRIIVVAKPTDQEKNKWNDIVKRWKEEQINKEINELMERKREELKDADTGAWPISELMRRIILDYFGDPRSFDTCKEVSNLEKMFEWENLAYELRAPWWNRDTSIKGLQSLRTTFLNASWAKVYIPIRPGSEEETISWLLALHLISPTPLIFPNLDDIEYYVRDMRQNLEPIFERSYQPGKDDAKEIEGPCDVLLTELGDDAWQNEYEAEPGFEVLNRWTVTIPTDGVDYESKSVRCEVESPPV